MAWNEPGNGQKKPGRGANDLDKIVQEWQQRLGAIFGGGSRGGKPGGSGSGIGGFGMLALALIAWTATGIYRVDEAERGVVLRFGAHEKTAGPGLRWHWPFPVETVEKVNVAEVDNFEKRNQMLTADEAFVVVGMAVQYRRTDPVKYLFSVRDPDDTLDEVSESAIREIVGKSTLDNILIENQAIIAQRTRQLVQETIDSYDLGIDVLSVNLQQVEFPEPVRDAVQDAVKAREDQRTRILAAQTYANDVVPKARGRAQRALEEAQAYRDRVIANAEGEAARFGALLVEYKKAPRVTRDRLYLDAVEEVYANNTKVFLDSGDGNNLTILPLDQLLQQRDFAAAAQAARDTAKNSNRSTGSRSSSGQSSADDPRARRTR